jgi:hypothetical protein
MNKVTLQIIARQLEATIRSSKPNVRYNALMNQIGALHSAIGELKDDEIIDETPISEEPSTKKKSKRGRKKKTSTED